MSSIVLKKLSRIANDFARGFTGKAPSPRTAVVADTTVPEVAVQSESEPVLRRVYVTDGKRNATVSIRITKGVQRRILFDYSQEIVRQIEMPPLEDVQAINDEVIICEARTILGWD